MKIKDPTNHNEIYPKLLRFLKSVYKQGKKYKAAISSGTPSMQACWILIAESGAFPLKLVRSDDPKWGVKLVRPVKLGTALPKIEKIKKENLELKKSALSKLSIRKKIPSVQIGDAELKLTPIEFVYYRFFAERAKKDMEYLRFGIVNVPEVFFKRVYDLHCDTFPDAEVSRITLEKHKHISCSTFRSNVTRINKKIKELVKNNIYSKYYCIESEGQKLSKRYGMSLPPQLIDIK